MTDMLPILSRTYALTTGGPGAVQELNWQLRDRITQTRDQLQADHPAWIRRAGFWSGLSGARGWPDCRC